MMHISRAMVIGWLSFALGALALPQFLAVIPEGYLPWVAAVAGIIALLLRWLHGALAANWLSAAGVLTLGAGVLSVPEFVAVIPLTWMPLITMAAAMLTLLARYFAGQSTTDPAKAVNLLFRTT